MKKSMIRVLCLLIQFSIFQFKSAHGQGTTSFGIIEGKAIDVETQAPLIGANVLVPNSVLGAVTDLDGQFVIKKVPVGNYSLELRYIGYEPLIKTDVIVRSQRITFVQAALKMIPLQSNEVTVKAGYFSKNDEHPLSITSFSYEEIRRAPGAAGDVSRIIYGLPSIAKVNDQSNSLIVRGGSPIENAFFLDNIEIHNINHFPTQGASGGPIGMVNVDFIQDVHLYTGGFSPAYGDRLSSIMELTLREGNRDEFDGQLDLNFAGFGGAAEGPMFNKKGSWLFSARRSYLDLIVKTIDIGTSVSPSYGDYQGKLVYDLNADHKLSLVTLWGDDHNDPDREVAIENDMQYYGNQDNYQKTTGINWRALWGKSGYSNTSVAYASEKYKEDFSETNTGMLIIKNRSHEQGVQFRNVNRFRIHPKHALEFGLEAKHLFPRYNSLYAEYFDALGGTVSATVLDKKITANKAGLFVNYIFKPFGRLTTTLGVRGDYFSYNKNTSFSPRFAFTYQVSDLTSVNGSLGMFSQNLPLVLLAQSGKDLKLRDPQAMHYVLGIDQLITEDTKLTLEAYQKDYCHFSIDPAQPALFMIDELNYRYSFFLSHPTLRDDGEAYSRGVELTIQKRLAKDFYGMAGASYFTSRYRGGDGIWRNRICDNRLILNLEGGYKPNNKWEFSLRWIYAGGTPYTPFDIEKSRAAKREVLDEGKINAARYPDYHSLNVRFDRRFNYKNSNLVFYLSVWNAYDRKNVATYFWDAGNDRVGTIYQWRLLPVFGFEYEF
jgi:hypothetical protein